MTVFVAMYRDPFRHRVNVDSVVHLFILILLWRCSPTWALAYSVRRLQASLSSADLLQFFRQSL